MSKRKKVNQSRVKRPSSSLTRQINEALSYWEDGDAQRCQQMLLDLAKKQPRSATILSSLLEVSAELGDWVSYAIYGEQYLPLIPKREQGDICNNLTYAHLQQGHPAIVRYYANRVLELSQDPELREQAEDMVGSMESFLLEHASEAISDLPLSDEAKFSLMLKHDWVRFYAETHQPARAIATVKTINEVAKPPIPVLNNLSLAYWRTGRMEEAVATAGKVLAAQPNNYHALANLVHFQFVMGKFDEARQYLEPLMQVESNDPDSYFKKMEALAYLGDDDAIIAVYNEIKGIPETPTMALSLHLAAAAFYRKNQPKKAWRLWRQALKIQPRFNLAQQSLADRNLPVGEREIPWYLPLNYWLTSDFTELLERLFVKETKGKTSQQQWKALVAERPYLPQLLPHILEKGDGPARNFVVGLLELFKPPEMMPMLYEFMRGRYGSDEIRSKAAQIVSQNAPELLPLDRMVPMWINGEQQNLLMITFQITDDKHEHVPHISDKILDKHEKAYDLLLKDKIDAAEKLLDEIIAAESNFPSAYNQLAVVYERQGKKDEARQLIEETHRRFPDYLFARVAVARLLCADKKFTEAEDLLRPVMLTEELHISEFRALAAAQLDLALSRDMPEHARFWLELWRQVDEDNPELLNWEMRLTRPQDLLKRLSQLFKK